jgi:hypothetical protein
LNGKFLVVPLIAETASKHGIYLQGRKLNEFKMFTLDLGLVHPVALVCNEK